MIEEVLDAVRRASSKMVDCSFEIEQKGSCENIVTTSDKEVQKLLCADLKSILPGCGFICEEDNVYDPDKEYVWIIDPIDGTANYARGIEFNCISVALKKNDEVILGVVFCPARKEMYWAEKGKGAFLNGMPIHSSNRSFKEALLCTAMSTYRKEYAPLCSEIIMDAYLQSNDLRRWGTAAFELCILASGYCELYFEMRLQPWDYAAGMLILTEAGGRISSLDGKLPRFNGPDMICAANNSENHEKFLSIIRSHMSKLPYYEEETR